MMQHQDTGTAASLDLRDAVETPIVLSIPARPEYVALSRLTIAALATRFGLDQEAASDLKLAVTEACSLFIRDAAVAPEPSIITVEFHLAEERWSISVAGTVGPNGLSGGDHPAGLSLVVIQALTDEVETQQEGSRGRLRFAKSVR
ncbi:MAG TPA: ATP-binding protein [Thermoleophilia bacterium]|nr:ATP-binding protein [Thermoleophilia bacterium]